MARNFDLDFLIPQYIGHEKQKVRDILHSQLEHRINLVRDVWKIRAGSKVLEIGGGQGDCTLVLAAAVGENGSVDAIDPCSLDYGAPWTVGEAQAYLKKGLLGSRMNFITTEPTEYLKSTSSTYDYVVMNNCLWYFDSPSRISDLLKLLATKKHAEKILIAEWALEARNLNQIPHVLAALTRANIEYLVKDSTENIRTAVSPGWLRRWFKERGIKVEHETLVTPPTAQKDGQWEVGTVVSDKFVDRSQIFARSEEQQVALQSMRDAVVSAVSMLPNGIKDVQCMEIWAAII